MAKGNPTCSAMSAPSSGGALHAWPLMVEEGSQSAGVAASATRDGPVETRPALRNVLIVEDEYLIAMELEHMLEDMGFAVVGIAGSAEAALSMVEKHRPDFLTMDISLVGERDGISAATEIYERFGLQSVFITAYGDRHIHERGRAAHPYGWLSKPLFRARFKSALFAMLSGNDA